MKRKKNICVFILPFGVVVAVFINSVTTFCKLRNAKSMFTLNYWSNLNIQYGKLVGGRRGRSEVEKGEEEDGSGLRGERGVRGRAIVREEYLYYIVVCGL